MPTLILLFTAAAVIQLICWIAFAVGFRRAVSINPIPSSSSEPVSVVVAVRDGAHSLPALRQGLAAQTHATYEVIIVDDHSGDDTAAFVRSWSTEDPRIRLISSLGHGKKAALSEGIASAANDLIAFTDVDCVPGVDWLAEIVRFHSSESDIVVAGYGPYVAASGVLNRLIRFETLHTALLMAAAIGLSRPYMAVGRNISYRKSTFLRLGGHGGSADLLSGDDDLFVQAVATRGLPVRFMSKPETFVHSVAPGRFMEWVGQKHRHFSTGPRYTFGSKAGLFVYHMSALACWAAPCVLGWVGLAVLLARLVPAYLVMGRTSSLLREPGLTPWVAPLDLAFQIYLVVVAPLAWLRPPREW